MSQYRKVSKGDVKGLLWEEIVHALPRNFLDDPVSSVKEMDGQVMKESRWRWAAIFPLPSGQRIFLKRDRTKDWIESMKYLFLPTKARKEWSVAYQLQKKNLDIPKPLGWMERGRWGFVSESYYLSEAMGSGVSLIDSVHSGMRFPLEELVKTVKKIHNVGLFHKDLHAGNFLWDGESLFLTDLHRAKILKRLSLKQRLWNLSHLFHSLRSTWEEKDQVLFVDQYFEGGRASSQEKEAFLQQIRSWMDGLQKRQWKSRTKRCLKESTEFTIENENGMCYYHRRDFSMDRIAGALRDHHDAIQERPAELKKLSQEVIISLSKDKGNRVCVKQFRYPNVWRRFKEHFRRSKGLRAWIAGNGLRARGFPSLKPLALLEKRDWLGLDVSFFLMEALETHVEMDRFILSGFDHFDDRRLFIKTFAEWLSRFHQMELYHRDMKTCNLLVSKEGKGYVFRFLDLEDVSLNKKVDEKRLFRNFLQLNTSIPKGISRTDRLRFLKGYTALHPIIKDQKGFMRQLIQKSKERGIVYVSPQGVVEENWV